MIKYPHLYAYKHIGFSVEQTERADAKTVPIVALTANAFDEDINDSLSAGMDGHLSKPVEPDKLYSTLASLIRK